MLGLRDQIAKRPNGAFFVITFVISWSLMMPAAIVGGLEGPAAALFFLGVFGPAASAMIVTRATGGSIRVWLRRIFNFRVPARYYLAAIAFPVILAVSASVAFALAGQSLDFGLVGERAAVFLPLFIYCLLLNGGPEELGWRGFALPGLERRHSPVRATVILGTLWGLWHLPLLRVEENAGHDLAAFALIAILLWTLAGFVAYSFIYTYAWNRTRSVVIAMALHAAFNTANGLVILRPEDELVGSAYVTISLALTGLLWLAALALVIATRGRLGLEVREPDVESAPISRRTGPTVPRHPVPAARG